MSGHRYVTATVSLHDARAGEAAGERTFKVPVLVDTEDGWSEGTAVVDKHAVAGLVRDIHDHAGCLMERDMEQERYRNGYLPVRDLLLNGPKEMPWTSLPPAPGPVEFSVSVEARVVDDFETGEES